MRATGRQDGGIGRGGPGVWFATLPSPVIPRPPLDEDIDVHVAVIGGGFTGFWTSSDLRMAVAAHRRAGA